MRLSIVIPAYNERENIPHLISRVASELRDIDFELIFVDDASTDGTPSLVKTACESVNVNLVLVPLKSRTGQHSCIRCGIKTAQGDQICVMSADLQEPIDLIPKMLEGSSSGTDLVIAVREWRQDDTVTDWFAKRFNLFLHKTVNEAFPSSGFDFYMFRSALKSQLDLDTQHFSYPQLDLVRCAQTIDYVKYPRTPRAYGRTKWSFYRRAELALRIINKYIIRRAFIRLNISHKPEEQYRAASSPASGPQQRHGSRG